MKYVIIDDEPAAIEVLKFHLKNIPFMELKATFRDPLVAIEYLQENDVDMMFLDINMPNLSGVNLPKLLKNPPHIVYTTAYSEYAIESYELNAVDYLLKPIEFDRLLQAVMKVKQVVSKKAKHSVAKEVSVVKASEKTIFIKSGAEFHQVSILSIKYIESDGNYVTFYTTKRSILARYKISEVLDLLPQQYFVRIHRSFIVALKHIDTVKKYCVLIDGSEIPISANYREGFLTMIEGMGNNQS